MIELKLIHDDVSSVVSDETHKVVLWPTTDSHKTSEHMFILHRNFERDSTSTM